MRTKRITVDPGRPWLRPGTGWNAAWGNEIEIPLETLFEGLQRKAAEHPDKPAFWFLGEKLSFGRLTACVEGLACSLYRLGVRKGDVVGILLPNSVQYVIAFYACARIGAWASGINPTYKPAEALHQLKLTRAKVLVTLDALYEPVLQPILDKSPVELLIHSNIADFLPWWKRSLGIRLGRIPTGKVPAGSHAFMDLVSCRDMAPEVAIDPEKDVATLIMTGGTTGIPKAAMLTHFNCIANVYQAKDYLPWGEKEQAVIGILPFFHSYGMTAVMNLVCLTGAWGLLFPKPPAMKDLCETIETVTSADSDLVFFPGAEVLFQKLGDYLETDAGRHSLRGRFSFCISGAGPLHRPVQERFERASGTLLREGYGLSECSPMVSAMPPLGERTFGAIGIPMRGTDWKIMDVETCSRELPPGEENAGELCVHGPQMMLGYLNRMEEGDDIFVEIEGRRWVRTGDIGWADDMGYVTLKDRKKQLIKYKGYSIFPNEIEQLVSGHPAVKEVAAFGIPDAEVNEVVKVWVVLNEAFRGKLTAEELISWCRSNLTHYKVPRYVEFVQELPKNTVGKVLRRKLAEADPMYRAAKGERHP